MHKTLQRRLPSTDVKGREVHRRLAQANGGAVPSIYDSDSGMNLLPGDPITITVTRVVQPATTTTVPSYPSSQSVPATLPNGSPPLPRTTTWTTTYVQATSTTPISLEQSSTPLPRASTASVGTGDLGSGDSNQGLEPVSGSSAPKKIHSGVLIGVIIVCILVAFGIAIYVVRTRYVRRRQRLRKGWTNSKVSRLSVAPEPKVPFSSSPPHRQQVPMFVKSRPSERSPLALDITETMPLAPPNSYGNDRSQSPVSATLTSSQSPIYGPPATKALGQPVTTVVSTFITALPDELAITVGESIRVLAEYDDGWALCLNARGEQGMIPMECLDGRFSMVAESISGNRGAGGNLRRVSSLQPGSVGSIGRF